MPAAEPRSRHLLVRDRRFHFLEWDGPQGRPVLFLHGAGLNAWTWGALCTRLSGRFRCYALDLRGHGDSEWANDLDYAPLTHAGDVAAFVECLGLERPVVVGASLGGTVALAYAQRHELRALVVVDTGPDLDATGRSHLNNFFTGPGELESFESFVELARLVNPRRSRQRLRESLKHNLLRLPDGRWTWKYDRRHYQHVSDRERDAARRQVWAAADLVQCPVLVVRGERSPILSRESAESVAAAFARGASVEIAGAGHTVQSDKPDALARMLEIFLDAEAGR